MIEGRFRGLGIEEYIISGSETVEQAMQRLEELKYKILFISDERGLRAAVTDGDIRRYLVNHKNLAARIIDAASQNPLAVTGYHEGRAREIIREKAISCVPMLDESGFIHELVFRDEVLYRDCGASGVPVIMMAGGKGTRLRPYTDILPKPLIPVGSMTITEQIMRRFKRFNCTDFRMVVKYKKELIKTYFSEVDTVVDLKFVDEPRFLGTGGGLSFFKGEFDGPVFVTNCDSVVEADYTAILDEHRRKGSIITVVCAEKRVEIPYGVVEASQGGEVTEFREKPSFGFLVNTGFYVVSPEFIDLVPSGKETPITDVIDTARKLGRRVGVYRIDDECFIDIGQLDDLRSVDVKLV